MAEGQAQRRWQALEGAGAMLLAVLAGLCIAYVDSRPHWDDTGVTVFSMVGVAFLLGCALPRRPWLWALGVGVWIPVHTMVRTGDPQAAVMLVVLLFPLAGSYSGAFLRRTLWPAGERPAAT
ncbi:MAG TPA: hypothetical protein VHZ73_12990 [Vicinamibacterales bacterium]|nr:hypothetical protein [Vicinamibacterales bacterium]